VNLVGSTEPTALVRHIDESLRGAAALPQRARVVDLGSGAGLPGIPVAIARPDLNMTLVEIRERRFHFLRHVVRTLRLERCGVERRRIEEPPEGPYDVALMRAVAPLPRALPMARPWIHDEGEVWIWARSRPPGLPEGAGPDIPLGGERAILRMRAHAVPRGTD
jgi:16S rRNA (guanine527-N7)-methyltransferase